MLLHVEKLYGLHIITIKCNKKIKIKGTVPLELRYI